MNERLAELIDQATRPRGPNKDTEFDKEYFAKLIVADCSEMVRCQWSELRSRFQ